MFAVFGVLLSFASAPLGVWVTLTAPAHCEGAADDFEGRVRASVIGAPAGSRQAHVEIVQRGSRYRVAVRTDGEAASGTKRLTTRSCDEAVAVAVAVLALALSEPAADSGEASADGSELAAASREPAAERSEPVSASDPPARPIVETPPSSSSAELSAADEPLAASVPVRVAVHAGMDAGTLASPTCYLGALAVMPAGPIEWRALVAYGVPSIEERIDPGVAELRREQFLLLDLGACYGRGDRVWLAGCAAGELSVLQRAHVHNEVASNRTGVRISGVLAAHVAYRGALLQPELELAAVAAAYGAPAARPLAFRASVGVGLSF